MFHSKPIEAARMYQQRIDVLRDFQSIAGCAALALAFILIGEIDMLRLHYNKPLAVSGAFSAGSLARAQPKDSVDRQGNVNSILARPLFSTMRRPAALNSKAILLPRLSGILVSNDDKIAIFAADTSDKPVVLHEGGQLGSFTLLAISPEQATLLGPNGLQILHPSFDGDDGRSIARIPPQTMRSDRPPPAQVYKGPRLAHGAWQETASLQ